MRTILLLTFYYLIRSGALAGGESETPKGFLTSARMHKCQYVDSTRQANHGKAFGNNKQQNEGEEDQPMPQFEGGNEKDHDQGQHQHFEHQFQQPETGFQQSYWEQQQQGFHLINEQLAGMQLQQQ
ncbi:hypothetical protein PIB30_087988 [Stylosanthes scabra]|uniref:Uncharacterized protein n=1 Tax=Stylosanthes scabra TaxID=79078 RepID=A0ABU6QUZ6_9FABA|nr:hypothetical protein [Stylosanthes scabra]